MNIAVACPYCEADGETSLGVPEPGSKVHIFTDVDNECSSGSDTFTMAIDSKCSSCGCEYGIRFFFGKYCRWEIEVSGVCEKHKIYEKKQPGCLSKTRMEEEAEEELEREEEVEEEEEEEKAQ